MKQKIMIKMKNPWLEIIENNLVLEEDKPLIDTFNRKTKKKENQIDTSLPPEPFVGDINNAEVFILSLNPGIKKTADINIDREYNKKFPDFEKQVIDNIHQNLDKEYPHFYLNPKNCLSEGFKYWTSKLSDLIENKDDLKKLSKKICTLEYFPYHSVNFKKPKDQLPSQKYTFEIVKKAMKNNKIIVLMRGMKIWKKEIKGLEEYNKLIQLNSPQNPKISEKNVKDNKFKILKRTIK